MIDDPRRQRGTSHVRGQPNALSDPGCELLRDRRSRVSNERSDCGTAFRVEAVVCGRSLCAQRAQPTRSRPAPRVRRAPRRRLRRPGAQSRRASSSATICRGRRVSRRSVPRSGIAHPPLASAWSHRRLPPRRPQEQLCPWPPLTSPRSVRPRRGHAPRTVSAPGPECYDSPGGRDQTGGRGAIEFVRGPGERRRTAP